MVHSQLEEEYLSVVASGWKDSEIHTGMVVDVLKKVHIIMSSRCTEKVEDVIDSFFSEVMLKGFDTLIKFSISEIVDKTSVGEHSIRHVIVLPTNTSILRCDVYYYRWNFASRRGIMEGVVGVLLLKRVTDVIKTDQTVLDCALSHTMSWTSRPHPKLIDLRMCGSPTVQAAFAILSAFVARWYAYILQLHTCLEVELDHGQVGARSRAGCPPSESSGVKVHVQPTVTAILNCFTC